MIEMWYRILKKVRQFCDGKWRMWHFFLAPNLNLEPFFWRQQWWNFDVRWWKKCALYLPLITELLSMQFFRFSGYLGDELHSSICEHHHTEFRDSCWRRVLDLWFQWNCRNGGWLIGSVYWFFILAMHVVLPDQSPK